jgi:hypothetical protein
MIITIILNMMSTILDFGDGSPHRLIWKETGVTIHISGTMRRIVYCPSS